MADYRFLEAEELTRYTRMHFSERWWLKL